MVNPSEKIIDSNVATLKFDKETKLFKDKPYLWEGQQWEFVEIKFPLIKIIFRNEIGIIVNCTNYDFYPPSVVYVDPTNFLPLSHQQIRSIVKGNFQYILDNHPETHVPFICLEGFWEYHTHPSHQNNPWSNHKRTKNINYCINAAYKRIYG